MSSLIKNLSFYSDGPSDNDILGILKKISQNPLTFIQFYNNSGKLSTLLEALVLCANAKILYISNNVTNLLISYNTAKKLLPKIKIAYAINDNSDYHGNTNILFITSNYAVKLFMEKCNSDINIFGSVIIIDNIETGDLSTDILSRAWDYLYNKKSCVLPYLVLTSCNNNIVKLPFEFNENNTYLIKGPKIDLDIRYHNRNYPPGNKKLYIDLYDKLLDYHHEYPLKDNEFSKWLVIIPNKKELEDIGKKIKKELVKTDIIIYTEDTGTSGISKAFKPSSGGKRTIILTQDFTDTGVYFQGVDAIFDSMENRVLYTTTTGGEKYFSRKISKTEAYTRLISNRNKEGCMCYRMCTKKYFDDLSYSKVPDFFRVNLHNYFIDLINNNINPEVIFYDRKNNNKFSKTIKDLKTTLSIVPDKNNFNTTDIGMFKAQKYLSNYAAALVYRWFEKDYPKFPIIVMASILEKGDSCFLWYPNKSSDVSMKDYLSQKKDFYNEKFNGLLSKNILIFYMRLWNKFATENKTLEINNDKLKEWCKENSINFSNFSSILMKIKELYDNLTDDYHIELGLFDSDKVFEKSKEILQSVYLCKIYRLKYKKYTNSENKKAIIDTRNHYNPIDDISKIIISFSESVKIDKNKEESTIGFYAPLD